MSRSGSRSDKVFHMETEEMIKASADAIKMQEQLRDCEGLPDAVVTVIRTATEEGLLKLKQPPSDLICQIGMV